MKPNLSPKQENFYRNSRSFFNIADGAVRSGKTHACLWRFLVHCLNGPAGELMVLGRTRDTVESNVVTPLKDMLGPKRVRYTAGSGRLVLAGRTVRVVGVNDAQAETKIRGATLAGSYCNELTLFEERAFRQLWDRHSVPGSKIFADTNPDTPFHWVHEGFLTNEALTEEDIFRVRFGLDDNPVLEQAYKERLKRAHAPGSVWYRRMVEGEWVAAEGAIYPMFSVENHVVRELPSVYERLLVGVDYGTTNPTVFLLIGRSRGVWYVIKEWRHDSQKAGKTYTDADYSLAMGEFLRVGDGYWAPETIEIDPSAASLRAQLLRDRRGRVVDAENEVLLGINHIASALSQDRLKVHESCRGLIREMANYTWDNKAQERGEDKPIKRDDHGPDALRYACMRAFGPQPLRAIRAVR